LLIDYNSINLASNVQIGGVECILCWRATFIELKQLICKLHVA